MNNKTHKTILYIEDDPASTEMINMLLENYPNMRLLTSWSAEEGLILADSYNPDMIFIDINLPRMNGNEAITELKKNPALQHAKMVAISSNVKLDQIDQSMRCGFDGYITKPVDLNKIIELIESL